jgi:PIN domain nuclease of toxin-antitoxin system
MQILIDTHILFWWFTRPSKVKQHHLDLIADRQNEILVSMISLFELYIKAGLGKVELPRDFTSTLQKESFSILNMEIPHLDTFSKLKLIHRDPFDRLIIAQAISEHIPLISYDKIFNKYPVKLI